MAGPWGQGRHGLLAEAGPGGHRSSSSWWNPNIKRLSGEGPCAPLSAELLGRAQPLRTRQGHWGDSGIL